MRIIDADALHSIVARALDANEAATDVTDAVEQEHRVLYWLLEKIEEQTIISPDEVRGVVHCGECVHADKDLPGAIYCTMWDTWEVPEDGFCFKGTKMEVEQ